MLDVFQKFSVSILVLMLLCPVMIQAFHLVGRKREAAYQRREREKVEEAARLERLRLLQEQAEEQRVRKKAEHDAAIDRICDGIHMLGITLRMGMGDELDEEDKAIVRRYQAQEEDLSAAIRRYAAVYGYELDEKPLQQA